MSGGSSNIRSRAAAGAGSGDRSPDLAPKYVKRLLAASARASHVGFALLDSETRFGAVSASLARENRVAADDHVGRSSCEIVGELARPLDALFEAVLRTGQPQSTVLTGHIRDAPEFGYWLNYAFPARSRSTKVSQIGVFVVNLTAENATAEILNGLVADPKHGLASAAGLLHMFDASVRSYHRSLHQCMAELACPLTEADRKAGHLRASLRRLDGDITDMRCLIYEVLAQFPIPRC